MLHMTVVTLRASIVFHTWLSNQRLALGRIADVQWLNPTLWWLEMARLVSLQSMWNLFCCGMWWQVVWQAAGELQPCNR